jgi:hypothetical protein
MADWWFLHKPVKYFYAVIFLQRNGDNGFGDGRFLNISNNHTFKSCYLPCRGDRFKILNFVKRAI